MGIIIKVTSQCGCEKCGVNMDMIAEMLDNNTNTLISTFKCPKCHIFKSVTVKLFYVDYYKGVRSHGK